MNDYREEMLSSFNWRTKTNNSHLQDDISINLTKDNRLSFSFRNACQERISSTGFISVCYHKNRIFFKESNARDGFKLTGGGSKKNKYIQINIVDTTEKAFIGDYKELKYDDFLELYYVEKKGNYNA